MTIQKSNQTIVTTICLALLTACTLTSESLANTSEIKALFGYGDGDTKTDYFMWGWGDKNDFDTQTYGLSYSHYLADLSETTNPEIAILKQHPSYVSATLQHYRLKYDSSGDSESSIASIVGRYSLPSGLGLGGGYSYAEDNNDGFFSGDSLDVHSYNLIADYSFNGQHEAALTINYSDMDFLDGEEVSIEFSWNSLLLGNSLLVNPQIGYSTTDYSSDYIISPDEKEWSFGIRLGHFWNNKMALYYGASYSKMDGDDDWGYPWGYIWTDQESTRYIYHIEPRYWFNDSVNASLTLKYIDYKFEANDSYLDYYWYSYYSLDIDSEMDELAATLTIKVRF